jgi:hypothetical protein
MIVQPRKKNWVVDCAKGGHGAYTNRAYNPCLLLQMLVLMLESMRICGILIRSEN